MTTSKANRKGKMFSCVFRDETRELLATLVERDGYHSQSACLAAALECLYKHPQRRTSQVDELAERIERIEAALMERKQ
jgi:Arc/MetJ-type ribon-helix-helix transcriptional regulator